MSEGLEYSLLSVGRYVHFGLLNMDSNLGYWSFATQPYHDQNVSNTIRWLMTNS